MKNFLWALIIVIVLGGGYYLFQGSAAPVPSDTATTTPGSNGTSGTDTTSGGSTEVNVGVGGEISVAPASATITYNGDSFSPQEVTIKKGGTVTWVNASGGKMWVASDEHPTHMEYDGTPRQEHCPNPGTVFDQCAGETGNYSFIFQKAGTWEYHDHLNADLIGKVVVE